MSDMPEWFNTDTASAYIGVTAATLRRLGSGAFPLVSGSGRSTFAT